MSVHQPRLLKEWCFCRLYRAVLVENTCVVLEMSEFDAMGGKRWTEVTRSTTEQNELVKHLLHGLVAEAPP